MMVSFETSQIKQFTERFFHQSGLFKIFQDTRYGIDDFFVSGGKFNYMGTEKIKLKKMPLLYIGDKADWLKIKNTCIIIASAFNEKLF